MLYSIYGLCLDADAPIPGLVPCEDYRPADVRVRLKPTGDEEPIEATTESIWYRSLWRDDTTGDPALTIFKSAEGGFRFRFVDGIEFIIDGFGTNVRATRPLTGTEEEVAIYLTGPVLGFLLRLRGVVSLHASAVAVGDRAVAFVGSAGAGKSTTAAAFATLGYPVLTEDVAALCAHDGTFAIRPGYPHIGLWPDSAAMLFGSPDALPRLTPGWDKRCLDLTATGGFVGRSLPLSAIYVLSASGVPGAPRVALLPTRSAMIALLGNIYGNRLFHRELRVQELDTVRHLVAAVPVREAIPSADPAALSALCEVILEDLSRRPARVLAEADTMRDVQHL